MAEATTQKLNYAMNPTKASGSRSYRTKIYPSNSTTAQANQTTIIDLPSNMPTTYMDYTNTVFTFTLTNNDAAAVVLDKAGCLALIKKIELVTSGGIVLSSIDEYGALASMFLSLQTDNTYLAGVGANMLGTTGDADGLSIAAGGSRKFCMPLVLTPLFDNKYWYLGSRDYLSIQITWHTAAKGTVGAATDSEIQFSNMSLISYFIELNPEVQQMVASNVGNKFKMICNDWRHTQASLGTEQSLVTTLGFSFNSLNRILFCHRGTSNTAAAYSQMNRSTRLINRYWFSLGGVQYPQVPVEVDLGSGAEVLYELEVAQHSLGSLQYDNSINNGGGFLLDAGAGTSNALSGRFLGGVNFESQHSGDKGLYSGVNSMGSQIQYNGEYATGVACVVDFYADYTVEYYLDMNVDGVWNKLT